MRQSRIFTDAELEAIELHKKGNKKDPTGIFYGRVKPKIMELLKLDRKELQRLIKKKKK